MLFRKRKQRTENNTTVLFIRAVKEMADKVKVEEPYIILKQQMKLEEERHQRFLQEFESAKTDRDKGEVIWKYFNR